MKHRFEWRAILLVVALAGMLSCEKDDPNNGRMPPAPVTPPQEEEDILPTPLAQENYSPSLLGKPYKPIMVEYSSKVPVTSWTQAKTRILPYLVEFTADTTAATYKSRTNRYGSCTDLPRQEVTGRFYVKKIDGRWWIVDPEGYLHYERSVASLRKGSSDRNKSAWNSRFGSDSRWMQITQAELASIGFHGSGAFCTDTYQVIQDHNRSNPDKPITLAPSFGFLSNFRQTMNYEYPGGSSSNAVGLVYYGGWESFCENYIRSALAPYLNDKNVLGFFSDNEINFSSASSKILSRFLAISDKTDKAYLAAAEFMEEKGASSVTDALNSEFAGRVAEIYYKGVKDAIDKIDPGMMYLGTRLHGTPKYLQGVVEAAGRYCDIVSINYYSRWSPELDTYVQKWDTWADAPFLVTEFYTKAMDSGLPNTSGAGFAVPTVKEKAYAYQHFTLGLLEAKNCVGWHWFKYQDDDGTDNDSKPANKGVYDNYYQMYPYLAKYMKNLNYNVYDLIEYFDN